MANAHITHFIQNLNEEEIKTAKAYIRQVLSTCKANSVESKQLILFNYIIANREKNIPESTLINITRTKNIASLKLRLYETITESLIVNRNIYNNIFSERDQVLFELKKKLLLLRMFERAGKRLNDFQYLFNDIIKDAEQYEIYEILIEALRLKKYTQIINSNIKAFEKIDAEIEFYDYCIKAAYYAGDCYYNLIINTHSIKFLSQKELDNYFYSSIKKMERDYKKTKSRNISYYLDIIRFAFYERKRNYRKAHEYCKKHLTILQKSKAIYRKNRVGSTLDNLSLFKTHLGDYKAAALDAKKAQEYFVKGSFNYIISKEQEMYTYIYSYNEKDALHCTAELLKYSVSDIGAFRRSKFIYYRSCALFISGNYKEALALLKLPIEIEKDKTRWNISLRIFKIMLYIELNKITQAEVALESLRKHIERQSKEEEIKARDILIVKVLRELEKNNFEFSAKNTNVVKALKELSEKDTSVSWEHYSTELVPFHKWLEGRKKL